MVGGDVDPRAGKYWFTENARDWVSDDLPSDKLNVINKIGEHFGYPIATRAICRTRNSPWVTSARNLPRLRSISADMSHPLG